VSLLPATAAHHCEEIRDRVHDDQWAVDRNEDIKRYPTSPSYGAFQTHVTEFLQELKHLYEPPICYHCSRLLQEVIVCYPLESLHLATDKRPSNTGAFCAVTIQMKYVLGRLLVQASHEFEVVTGLPFIETTETIDAAIADILKFLIEAFLGMWSDGLPEVVWESAEAVDDAVRRTFQVIFAGLLNREVYYSFIVHWKKFKWELIGCRMARALGQVVSGA
jgi:hypothetical protein